jgi:hypothetical protein
MHLKCLVGMHEWAGCKCPKCGKTRDEGHKWAGCKCPKCGKTRDEGHDWSVDCEKCSRCTKTRNVGHQLKNCRCEICRFVRHQWSLCKCEICGEIRNKEHDWQRGKCIVCGRQEPKGSRRSGDAPSGPHRPTKEKASVVIHIQKGPTNIEFVRNLYFNESRERDNAYDILRADRQYRSDFPYLQKRNLHTTTMYEYAIAVGPYTYDKDAALAAGRILLSNKGCDYEESERVAYSELLRCSNEA